MKIQPINTSRNYSFKSNNTEPDLERIAYDDEISQKRREYIRAHYNPIPYYDILEGQGRMEEYELNKLIGSLVGKNINKDSLNKLIKNKNIDIEPTITAATSDSKPINTTIMHNLNKELLVNVTPILGTKASYRGSFSDITPQAMDALAKAGIKRVVSFTTTEFKQMDFKKHGLEYHEFSPLKDIFSNAGLYEAEDFKFDISSSLDPELGITEDDIKKLIHKNNKKFQKLKYQFIQSFVEFIQTMQKDFVYVGCDFGTYKTDNALLLNHFFNPTAKNTPTCITSMNYDELEYLKTLYNNLTEKTKIQLGWNKEFEKEFIPRLNKAIKTHH